MKNEEDIREAFKRVAIDIDFLYQEIYSLKREIKEIQKNIFRIFDTLNQTNKNLLNNEFSFKPIEPKNNSKLNPAIQHINQTDIHQVPTKTYTNSLKFDTKKLFSTGNEGVPTDRQTNRQTDKNPSIPVKNTFIEDSNNQTKNPLDKAVEMLDSLDTIKKELRLTFKKLTEQETLIFSLIYQLDEEKGSTNYKELAEKLKLTESSIRDYVGRLIKKGIPIEKRKINNKLVQLSISKNLKKIAPLSTILQLRDL
ncbi:MAG: winged helix-turn-helix transcriptional regulator [Candidatus Pacearchaeota archaeon]